MCTEPCAQSEGDLLAVVARININKVKQYEAFQEVENNFHAYDFDDVHFYAVPRADTEPRDGKNYLIELPPEIWLFTGLNNGTVRPRSKGKGVGPAQPLRAIGDVHVEGGDPVPKDQLIGWDGKNLTTWAFNNLIPHYFKFPPFPEERGYANEVQRARMGARCNLPKVLIVNTVENSESVDMDAYHNALTEAGIVLKSTGQGVLFQMTLPEVELDEVYKLMGIHDPLQAKLHLLQDNAVHVVYFDPVSLLFGSQYYTIDEVKTSKKIIGLVLQMAMKQPSTLGAEWKNSLRAPLRTAAEVTQDKAKKHFRAHLNEASFAGMMAQVEGQKPFPGAMGSEEWSKVYGRNDDNTFYVKDEKLKEIDEAEKKKKNKHKKKKVGKTSNASANIGTASTDDRSKQCAANDVACHMRNAATDGSMRGAAVNPKASGRKGHDEL